MSGIYVRTQLENNKNAVFEKIVNFNYQQRTRQGFRRFFSTSVNDSQQVSSRIASVEGSATALIKRRKSKARRLSFTKAINTFGSIENKPNKIKEQEILQTFEDYVREVVNVNSNADFEQLLAEKFKQNNITHNLTTREAHQYKKVFENKFREKIEKKILEKLDKFRKTQTSTSNTADNNNQQAFLTLQKQATLFRKTQAGPKTQESYLTKIKNMISPKSDAQRLSSMRKKEEPITNRENAKLDIPDNIVGTTNSISDSCDSQQDRSNKSSEKCISDIYKNKLKDQIQILKQNKGGGDKKQELLDQFKQDVFANAVFKLLDKVDDDKQETRLKLGHRKRRDQDEIQSQTNNMLYEISQRTKTRAQTTSIDDSKYKRRQIDKIVRQKQLRNPQQDPKQVEKDYIKLLKKQGILNNKNDLIPDDSFLGFDKFGREKDPILEQNMLEMYRPRIEIRKKGQLSLGDQQLLKRLEAIGQNHSINYEADSLVQSAFNSSDNKIWDQYRLSIDNPPVTEASYENIQLYEEQKSLNINVADSLQSQDKLMLKQNDSGSSFSSVYSFQKSDQDSPRTGLTELTRYFDGNVDGKNIDKYCFFKLTGGLKLPLLKGTRDRRFTIGEIIEISSNLIRLSKREKKFSASVLQKIINIYQREFGSAPLDLIKSMSIRGHIFLKNYKMSEAQFNAFICVIPYILNLRYINIQNCSLKDEQAALLVKALSSISKIQSILIGQNLIGPKFIAELKQQVILKQKIEEFSICHMEKTSMRQFVDLIQVLQGYSQLKILDISGNIFTNQISLEFVKFLENAQNLKVLNLSSCLFNNEVTRKVLRGLLSNKSIKYLNLSNNKFNSPEFEFGSIIGRIIQVMEFLDHLDISCCKLAQPELLYIAMCMKSSKSLRAVHMSLNNVDYTGRVMIRHILQSKVKHPFRSKIQICDFIKTSQDKQQVLILNTYIMSGLPQDFGQTAIPPLNTQYESESPKKELNLPILHCQIPIRSMKDVRERITKMSQSNPILEQFSYSTQAHIELEEIFQIREELKKGEFDFRNKKQQKPIEEINDVEKDKESIKNQNMWQKKMKQLNCHKLVKRVEILLKEKEEEEMDRYWNAQQKKYEKIEEAQNTNKDNELKILGSLRNNIMDIQEHQVNELVDRYFNKKETRIYDMIYFMDMYGHQAILKNYEENPIQKIQSKLSRMPTINQKKTDYYKQLDAIKLTQDIKTIEDVFLQKRELQMMKNLKSLVLAQGTKNDKMIERIQEIFAWGFMINDYDTLQRDSMINFNPMQDTSMNIVFQRILDEPDLDNKDSEGNVIWEDTSQCFQCNRHNKIFIQVDQFMADNEYQDLMQLSSILYDENKIYQTLECNPLDNENGLLPIFEDIFEEVPIQNIPKMFKAEQKPSQTDLFLPHDQIQSELIKPEKQEILNIIQEDSSDVDSYWVEFGSEDEKPLPVQSEKVPKQTTPALQNAYDFKSHLSGRNVMPIASIQNTDILADYAQCALTMNRHLYSPNIFGQAISIRKMTEIVSEQKVISPEEQTIIQTLNKYAPKSEQRIIHNGIILKNFYVRNDLMDAAKDLESDVNTSCEDQQIEVLSESDQSQSEYEAENKSQNTNNQAETNEKMFPNGDADLFQLDLLNKSSESRNKVSKLFRKQKNSSQSQKKGDQPLQLIKRQSTTKSFKSPRKEEKVYDMTSYFICDQKQSTLQRIISDIQEKIDLSQNLNRQQKVDQEKQSDIKDGLHKLKRRQIEVQKKQITNAMKYALKKERLFLIGQQNCPKLQKMVATLLEYEIALSIFYVDKFTKKIENATFDSQSRILLIQDSFLSLTGGERVFPQIFISELFLGSNLSALVSKIKSRRLFQLLEQAGISYKNINDQVKSKPKNKEQLKKRLKIFNKDYKKMETSDFKSQQQVQEQVANGIGREVAQIAQKKEKYVPKHKPVSALESFRDQIRHNWFQLRQTKDQEQSLSSKKSIQKSQIKQEQQKTSKHMYLVASFNHWFPIKMISQNLDDYTMSKENQFMYGESPSVLNTQEGASVLETSTFSEGNVEKFKFCEFVPAGDHFFYFVNQDDKYCLSPNYKIKQFPGTSLRMNTIFVEPSQSGEMNLVRYKQNYYGQREFI